MEKPFPRVGTQFGQQLQAKKVVFNEVRWNTEEEYSGEWFG